MALAGILKKGRRVSEFFGRHQNWYLQLGIAGFIIAGVHLGADRIDDGCFAVLNFIDRIIDDGMARLFHLAQLMGLTSPEGASDLTYGFADLIDVEAREAAARWVAVGLELWVDFVLGRAALQYREDPAFGRGLLDMPVELSRTVKAVARRTRELVDVEFVALPLSLLIGLIASTYVVFVVSSETFQQLFYWWSGVGGVIAVILAYVITAMVFWSLGIRALTSALRYVQQRAEDARSGFVYRVRGVTLLVTALPVCALGCLFGTPVGGWF